MVPFEPHLAALIGGWLAALVLGGAVLWLAPRIRAIAVPNERSSHEAPTPTLGGIAFVVPLVAWFAFSAADSGTGVASGMVTGMNLASVLAWVAGGLALIGLVDDLRDVPALVRLLVQIAGAGWLVATLWPDLGLAGGAIAVVLVVWFVNLCNFMDGIDGILGVQVLVFGIGVVLLNQAPMSWLVQTTWLLIGGMLGFLSYNWPPARFFMGDVGSVFLGVVMATIAVELARIEALPFAASVVLLSVFWFDATYTLCVRIATKQRFFAAHRSHLYQRVAQVKGHLWTTTAFLAYAAFVLLPLAWLSTRVPSMEWGAVGFAVLPVAFLAWRMGAGLPQGEPASS